MSDLWRIYTCRDQGFIAFVQLAADMKIEAVREAQGG